MLTPSVSVSHRLSVLWVSAHSFEKVRFCLVEVTEVTGQSRQRCVVGAVWRLREAERTYVPRHGGTAL